MMLASGAPFRFRLHKERAIEAIDFLAQEWPGITQYYIGKTFFFADREHFLDWGSVISGDRYFAMEHGPVPSRIYDLLKPGSGEEDDWVSYFNSRLSISPEGNLLHVFSKGRNDLPHLSDSHKEYLQQWVRRVRPMSFGALADLAHQDESWRRAWALPGNANEMDVTYWIDPNNPERERIIASMQEAAIFSAQEVVGLPEQEAVAFAD